MTSVRTFALLGTLALGAASLSGCTDWAGYDLDRASGAIPQLANMRSSVIPDPYAMPREAPEHAIPSAGGNGAVPRFGQAQLDSAAATLVNPLRPTPEVLRRGEIKFEQNCAACHGPLGRGDGPVVTPDPVSKQPKFPFAPSLVAPPATTRSDGYLYAVIAAGRNFMPPYGERIAEQDRWAVVLYVRHLQGSRAAPAAVAPVTAPTQGAAEAPAGQGTPAAPTVSSSAPAPAGGAQTPR